MDLSLYTGKITISFRVFQQKRHSCIFKTDPREGAKVIMTQYKRALRQI